ncbi:hypothetical protein D3C76_1847090 [compost metagenome]
MVLVGQALQVLPDWLDRQVRQVLPGWLARRVLPELLALLVQPVRAQSFRLHLEDLLL